MTAQSLSSLWSATLPAVANHLWQSTLVVIAAAALTLLLRKHNARARYWIWLAASLKFLVPFSVLVQLGTYLSWTHVTVPSASPVLFVAMEEVGKPFNQSAGVVATPQHLPVISSSLPHLTSVAEIVWLIGFVAVVIFWVARWMRVSALIRKAVPPPEGRELQTLRRTERLLGSSKPSPITLLLSSAPLEPGVFGILKPVLLWPAGISQHLDDSHIEAIVAHEVWHVRRRDNLSAALHMLVEAVFWFYPLVWWLGARLIHERERACDEEVVAIGNDRHVYAESILKVCEFCLSSPLVCVSGVTGADLKQRMVHIMSDRILHKLDFARKFLLTTAVFLAIALPITFGLFHATPSRAQDQSANTNLPTPVYSSVSIKPSTIQEGDNRSKMMFSFNDGGFVANGVTLQKLIQMAYHVQPAQISGPQDFLNKTQFDVKATLAPAVVSAMHEQMNDHKDFDDQAVLKSLLAGEFKLALHPETRNVDAYDLVADEDGVKIQLSSNKFQRMFHVGPGELTSSGAPLELLTEQLSERLGRPVVNKTGLNGIYAFSLHWTPDPSEQQNLKQSGAWVAPEPTPDANGPSLETALQEQLGLKLVPQKESVQVLVIDHAEQPSEN